MAVATLLRFRLQAADRLEEAAADPLSLGCFDSNRIAVLPEIFEGLLSGSCHTASR